MFNEAWIFDHATELLQQEVGNTNLAQYGADWKAFCALTTPDVTIYLYGCQVGTNETYIQTLANEGNRKVVAWTGDNGSGEKGHPIPQGKRIEKSPEPGYKIIGPRPVRKKDDK